MASVSVDKSTLDRVRTNFVTKRDVIVTRTLKSWTPWELTHLLEINDEDTTESVELIL